MTAVHCWEDHTDEVGERYTCLLPDGHDGPHKWTPDSDIIVTFGEPAPDDPTQDLRRTDAR